MPIRAVLFDLDQTLWLVEATPDWDEITRLQAADLAPHVARARIGHLDLTELIRRFWANWDAANALPNPTLEELNRVAIMQQTLAAYGVPCADGDGDYLCDALLNIPLRSFNIRPYPDAIATVEALSAAGYRLGVVTNRLLRPAILRRELQDQGFPEVFDVIVSSGDVGYRKPHRLVFESALRQLGVQAAEALVVGDSYENDVAGAAQLGMIAVLKLNERAPDVGWALVRYQVPSLAALLQLGVLGRR